MKTDLVIVTSFKREELLWLCLEAIRREDSEIPIYIFSDRGHGSPELEYTHRTFRANCIIRDPHEYYGNSYNLIDACQWAAKLPVEIIHLIEEDTIIHAGYFHWARTRLASREYACVCGRIGSPHIPNWYESPCASWLTSHMKDALAHLVPGYFCELRTAMQIILDDEMFPNSKYKKGGAEQDGFFLRCIEYHGWKTKFPDKPLATHLGWWGYNCPPGREAPSGSFEDRIEACRAMLLNKQERRNLFGHRIADAEMEGMGI